MDKRFLLAFLLSFVVLWGWSILFPNKTQRTYPQTIDSKQDVSQSVSSSVVPVVASPLSDVIIPNKDEIKQTLESDKLSLAFSNVGGNLDSVNLKEYQHVFPLNKVIALNRYNDVVFRETKNNGKEIVYEYDDKDVHIAKTYIFSEIEYSILAEIKIKNKNKMSNVNNFDINAFSLEMSKIDKSSYDKNLNEYVVYIGQNMIRKNDAVHFTEKDNRDLQGKTDWVGFRDKYYSLIVKPEYDAHGFSSSVKNKTSLDLILKSKGVEIAEDGEVSFNYFIFAGPEKMALITSIDKDFGKIKMFYRNGLLNITSKIIHDVLHFFYKIIPNWGVSIILIAIFIYFAMYPLTMKSMTSMKKMQELQPKMAELKEKYKNNQQKLSAETMQLYKDNKINPLGGCLPFLFQMPVFIGIYQVLWRDVSFKDAGFLWIRDLAAPDRLFVFSPQIELNFLPLAYAALMFFQQKLSAKNMVISDPTQAQVQKMMANFMPIMLGFIFYKFPSGVNLYFVVYFLLTTLTQWKMASK